MYITCLDLEGVLVPEIWIAFSEVSGIPELRRTTRDEPDYEKLMRWRMDILSRPARERAEKGQGKAGRGSLKNTDTLPPPPDLKIPDAGVSSVRYFCDAKA